MMTRQHEIFAHFKGWAGEAPPELFVDWIGSKTPAAIEARQWTPHSRAAHESPPLDEEYFEWIDILQMARQADGVFTFLEVGAGYGRWSARAGCAAGQLGKKIRLGLVEAAPKRIEHIRQVMAVNAIAPEDYQIYPYAIAKEPGEGAFIVEWPDGNEPPNWFGQALTENSMAGATVVGEQDGFPLWRMADGWGVIKIPQQPLSTVISQYALIDLADIDVQGAEGGAVEESLGLLTERVRRLHIGTHSHEIEAQLRTLLAGAGWECLQDYSCAQENDTPFGRVSFVDGVQTWDNLKLTR